MNTYFLWRRRCSAMPADSLCGDAYYWGEEPLDDAALERPTEMNGPAAAAVAAALCKPEMKKSICGKADLYSIYIYMKRWCTT